MEVVADMIINTQNKQHLHMYVDMTLDIGMLIILSKTSLFWDSADYNGTACQTKVLLGSMTIFWSAVLKS